jgi:hypothetical protein
MVAGSPSIEFRERLLDRLNRIADALRRDADALALLALGSVGAERERIDEYSDLDFFVIVRDGAKHRFIDDLSWLHGAQPLVWHFQNTVDGHKALMSDGVFCEFAVFERRELANIAYSPGQFVWRRDEIEESLARPQCQPPKARERAWLVGEALSNLLIGLGRYARGEKLAAMRMVQVYALDRLLEIKEQSVPATTSPRDPFNVDRRIEQRLARATLALNVLAGGYAHTPEAAAALFDELESLSPVSQEMATHIRHLIELCKPNDDNARQSTPRAST